jgi:hypothetical protein
MPALPSHRSATVVRFHHFEGEAGEGRSEPGGVSVLHAAERSGGGEQAQPRVGACEPTQSAVESAPELRSSLGQMDGLGEGLRHWLSVSAFAFATLSVSAFAFATLAVLTFCCTIGSCSIGSTRTETHVA